jgi:hypothetical protein
MLHLLRPLSNASHACLFSSDLPRFASGKLICSLAPVGSPGALYRLGYTHTRTEFSHSQNELIRAHAVPDRSLPAVTQRVVSRLNSRVAAGPGVQIYRLGRSCMSFDSGKVTTFTNPGN